MGGGKRVIGRERGGRSDWATRRLVAQGEKRLSGVSLAGCRLACGGAARLLLSRRYLRQNMVGVVGGGRLLGSFPLRTYSQSLFSRCCAHRLFYL